MCGYDCIYLSVDVYVCYLKKKKVYIYVYIYVVLLQFSCLDFNECVFNNGGCEQQCINNIPSFECRCDEGFVLNSDGFSCNGIYMSV